MGQPKFEYHPSPEDEADAEKAGEERIPADIIDAAINQEAIAKVDRLRNQMRKSRQDAEAEQADGNFSDEQKAVMAKIRKEEMDFMAREIADTIEKNDLRESPEEISDADIIEDDRTEVTPDMVVEEAEEVADEMIVGETTAEEIMKLDEQNRLQKELAGLDLKLKRVGLDIRPELREEFEALSDKAATSLLGKARLAMWRLRQTPFERKLLDEHADLERQKVGTLRALSELKITPEEVARMRAARGRRSEAARKPRQGGRFSS